MLGGWSGMRTTFESFLLGFPALISILSPLNNSLVFRAITSNASPAARAALAGRVSLYSLFVMLMALWLGAPILRVFGVSLAALRVAGGLMIAAYGWSLLSVSDSANEAAAPQTGNIFDHAVVPLTIPLTAGPGTIAVAIGLSSDHAGSGHEEMLFMLGLSLAAVASTVVVFLAYRFVDAVAARLGAGTMRVVTRLIAFVLLCIGVQIMILGVTDVLGPLLAGTRGG
jgi:multiple antibiotic resistance protein